MAIQTNAQHKRAAAQCALPETANLFGDDELEPAIPGGDQDDGPHDFTDFEIVQLHWLLLRKIRLLCDPGAPLEEKFELVRWIFTEPERDQRPFSFVNCVNIIACHPESTQPFFGLVDPEEIREFIAHNLRRWFEESLALLPDWVRELVIKNPQWVSDMLYMNPQWINQRVRKCSSSTSGMLF